jgi:hypothetical protein
MYCSTGFGAHARDSRGRHRCRSAVSHLRRRTRRCVRTRADWRRQPAIHSDHRRRRLWGRTRQHWQTIHDDGNIELEAHYAFRAGDGAVVEVISSGVRAAPAEVMRRLQAQESVDPGEYYFRTAMRFRTGAKSLWHLNFRLAIATGERHARRVRLRVFEVL